MKIVKIPNNSSVSSIIENMKVILAGNKKLKTQVDEIWKTLY